MEHAPNTAIWQSRCRDVGCSADRMTDLPSQSVGMDEADVSTATEDLRHNLLRWLGLPITTFRRGDLFPVTCLHLFGLSLGFACGELCPVLLVIVYDRLCGRELPKMAEFWLISAPGEPTPDRAWSILQERTTRDSDLSKNYKINLPELKVGGRFRTLSWILPIADWVLLRAEEGGFRFQVPWSDS